MSQYLIASDGSEHALAAQRLVASLPFQERPSVRLTAVTQLPAPLSEYYSESVLLEQARQIQNNVVAPRLSNEGESLRSVFASVTTELRIGDPANEVLTAAKEHKTDVIVVGARGLSAVPRFLLGSMSDYVCRHAPQSVLVVRQPPHSAGTAEVLPPQRVLFATDGSDSANAAINRFASWKWPAGSQARIITAHQVVRMFGVEIVHEEEPYHTARRLEAEALLQSATMRLEKAFPHVESAICDASHITDTIVAEAEKWKADLLVIGSHGKGFWERVMLGSTSLGVLHHAPCSVWVEKLPA